MENAGYERAIDSDIADDIHRRAAKLVPELAGVRPIDCWNGLRPATDVGPVIGRVAGTNIWTGAGTSTGAPLNVTLSSPEAINVPPVIRVYMNYRQSDQRGFVVTPLTGAGLRSNCARRRKWRRSAN